MNRKNAIRLFFYLFLVAIVVGIFAYQLDRNKQLEETLHEHEEILSVTLTALQETETSLKERVDEIEDLSTQLSTVQGEAKDLTAKVSELTTANEKLKNEKKKLESDYETLKKNKAIAAAKAKQQATQSKKEYIMPSRSNDPSATKTFYVEATAYTAYCAGCSGITATGINLRANPELKVIAVDPRVIPLGSKVWVDGYGYAVAGDTGGAIKGNKVDLFMPSKTDAYKWGRKTVQIKVLN